MGKLSGAVGNYAATDPELERIACERLGLEPAPASTQILQRDRHATVLAALAVAAASLEKFALEVRHLARTEVREVEEPFGRGPEGLLGDAAQAQPGRRPSESAGSPASFGPRLVVGFENVALWHERDISHSSAERVVIPDAFLALDYMLDRFTWLAEGLVVRPEQMRRNLDASHGLFFSQRVLLALVAAGLGRDEAYRLVQRSAMRAWDEETGLPGSRRGGSRDHGRPRRDRPSPRRSTSRPTPATRTPSSSGSAHSPRRRNPSMPDAAVHVGSGKVRELYALDDDRLLLVASDRISTFDVVLPTEVPDKGRVLCGLSAFWFARTSELCPNHLLAVRDDARSMECRRLEMLPIECVVRGYLAGSGWKDYREIGRRVRAPAAGGPAGVGPAARAALHAGDEGRRAATTRTSTWRRRPGSSAASDSTRCRRPRSPCIASRPRTPSNGASSSPTPSSSSGWTTRTAPSCSPTRRSRRTPPASGRPTSTRPAARSRRSTSSSCATTASRSAGTRPHPAPSFRTMSSPAPAPATWMRSNGSPGSRSTTTSNDPDTVLR